MSELKKLTQAVFIGQPEWIKSAAVDSDGVVNGFSSPKSTLKRRLSIWTKGDVYASECEIGVGFDATNWQDSAIDREVTE